MTPKLPAEAVEAITSSGLGCLTIYDSISDETNIALAAAWRKYLHQLNSDDLEGCCLALLDELMKRPKIPLNIADKLQDAYDHYITTAGASASFRRTPLQQVYAMMSQIDLYPLSVVIFHYREDAIKAAREKAYDGVRASPNHRLKETFGGIYDGDSTGLVANTVFYGFQDPIYAATWESYTGGSVQNGVIVVELPVQGSLDL
jgi:hypothetical protein